MLLPKDMRVALARVVAVTMPSVISKSLLLLLLLLLLPSHGIVRYSV